MRRIVVAGALLLAVVTALALQLNAEHISQRFHQQLNSDTAVRLNAERTSLTWMHGFGLRLDNVSITHPAYHMEAGHMTISLRLLSLLVGHTEVSSLDLHDAVITIQPASLSPTSAAISSLPVQRIHLVRSRIQTADGMTLLDNLHMDMRNIGANSETLWELNAKQGKQSLSGNGRLQFHDGQISRGFSKVKMEHFDLNRLQPFAPPALMHWLQSEGELLSGAATLDIGQQQAWALFGEVELEPSDSTDQQQPDRPSLRLRGKLSHSATGEMSWRDSFIHIGNQAVIAIDGACRQQQDCSTRLDASDVPLTAWGPFIPAGITLFDHIAGRTDLKATVNWDKQQWQATGSVQLHDAVYQHGDTHISLPPLQLQADELSGNAHLWHIQTSISTGDSHGAIQLKTAQHSNGDRELNIDIHDTDSVLWQPLSRLLLAALGQNAELQGSGNLQATVALHEHAGEPSLDIDLDVTEAQLQYGPWLDKAAGIPARCHANIDFTHHRIRAFTMQNCQLDQSSIGKLSWSRFKQRNRLNIEQLDMDIEQFRKLLPVQMQHWRGQLLGHGKSNWQGDVRWSGSHSWYRHLSGEWQLNAIASTHWQVNGLVKTEDGIFRSHGFELSGSLGEARLTGFLNPARMRGDIDLLSGTLLWDQLSHDAESDTEAGTPLADTAPSDQQEPDEQPPGAQLSDKQSPDKQSTAATVDPQAVHETVPFWKQLRLRGRIRQAELTLLDNHWQHIRSDYVLHHGALSLMHAEAELAGGQFSSRELTLTPGPDGVDIDGHIRTKNIRLKKLSRLHGWLQAALGGKLQANVIVHGRIGPTQLSDWQGSNGDILIYDGNWKQHQRPDAAMEKLGTWDPTLKSYVFRTLSFRFHADDQGVDINHIRLKHLKEQYHGTASIAPDLRLRGRVQQQADHSYRINDTILPQMNWHSPPSGSSNHQ